MLASVLAAGVTTSAPAQKTWASDHEQLKLEQSFILFRHGLRSPLNGEAAAAQFMQAPMPAWNEPPGNLTEHGAEAARLLGRYLRSDYASLGLLPVAGCPSRTAIDVYSNSVERTIATAKAMTNGLAPGCGLRIRHRPVGQLDPVFAPVEAEAAGFDAAAAARAIVSSVGGLDRLINPHAAEFRVLERVLGCAAAKTPCDIAGMGSTLEASGDGHALVLGGPIAVASGTVEVFLLQYMQGLPMGQVAWGRADAAALARMSVLHSLLFDVMARPRLMSTLISAPLRTLVSQALRHPTARLTMLVGHDDNIAGLASWLGLEFSVPGYGANDPPIGGGLGFEVWRTATDRRYVRAVYISQTPDQIRNLVRLSRLRPPFEVTLPLPGCDDGPGHTCLIGEFLKLLSSEPAH